MPNEPNWQYNALTNEFWNQPNRLSARVNPGDIIRQPYFMDSIYDWTEWMSLTITTEIVWLDWFWPHIYRYDCVNCWNKLRINRRLPWLYICKKCTDEKTRVCKN